VLGEGARRAWIGVMRQRGLGAAYARVWRVLVEGGACPRRRVVVLANGDDGA